MSRRYCSGVSRIIWRLTNDDGDNGGVCIDDDGNDDDDDDDDVYERVDDVSI